MTSVVERLRGLNKTTERKKMDIDKIVQKLAKKTKIVKFVSEKGVNSCNICRSYHGKIFTEDDPQKPELPLHPNCRCKFVEEQPFLSENILGKTKPFINNLPEATKMALEMRFLPFLAGEAIGTTQIATLTATDYNFWATKARTAVLVALMYNDKKRDNVLNELALARSRKDIRTIIRIYKTYTSQR